MKYTEKEVVDILKEYRETVWVNGATANELNNFLEEKGLIKEEFEVGEWYKGQRTYGWLICVETVRRNSLTGYGVCTTDNEWEDVFDGSVNDYNWTLATDKEVEDALIKEAEKLIEKGVVKCLHECTDIYPTDSIVYFNWDGDCLRVTVKGGCCCIFDKGNWATIIEEPKEIVVNGITYVEK
mgnify:CR=1 FL=1|tara:strand:+ start:10281 stop:10826 length:546 start_codon:yes stop_codon:yes gene_type:complete